MKKVFLFFALALAFVSCASAPNKTPAANESDSTVSASANVPTASSLSEEYSITTDIFDTLQRPLGHNLSPQLRPVGRMNWEYCILGVDMWDLYLLSGKKIGNGVFEKPVETKANCQVIELHSIKSQYDNTVISVDIIFVSQDRNVVEKLKNEFQQEAVRFFGNSGDVSNANQNTISWTSGWFYYVSRDIQRHENGNWVCVIRSLDLLHAPY